MAEVVRYVNTASTAGGDGTTNATAGANRAYASLNEWEAAEQTDLVTATDTHVVKCCGSSADTTVTIITGWTTNATYFVTVQGNRAETDGFNDTDVDYSTSHYRLEAAKANFITPASGCVLGLTGTYYTVLDGIQVKNTATSAGQWIIAILAGDVAASVSHTVKNCRTSVTNYTGSAGIFVGGNNCIIHNNIVVGGGSSSYGIRLYSTPHADSVKMYNNTIRNNNKGIQISSASSTSNVIKNNAIFDCADDINDAGSSTIDYNATDDLDGTNTQDMSSGGTEADGWNDALTDYANGDYTVLDTGSVLHENGVGSGTDSDVPTTDILGNTRSTTAPSIGAFEYQAAASAFVPRMMIY